MKKTVFLLLKILGGLLATVVVILTGLFIALNTSYVQNKLMQHATAELQDYLQTEVKIDSISVHIFGEDLLMHGLKVKDRQQRDMLELEQLGVELKLANLMKRQIYITEAQVKGLTARLYKPATDSDSVANYQFIIDAFKKNKKDAPKDSIGQPKKKKEKFTFEADLIELERIHLTFNDKKSELGRLVYKRNRKGQQHIDLRDVVYEWYRTNKKGIKFFQRLRLAKMDAYEKDGRRFIDIDSVFYFTNNPLPRKNTNKPKRGFFDAGHFDIKAALHFELLHADKDSVVAQLTKGNILDRGSDLNITSLQLRAHTDMKTIHLSDVVIKMPCTALGFKSATVQLPSKKLNRPFTFQTSLIRGRTLLHDIARPFAPVLKHFNTPVYFQTVMFGDSDNLHFRNIRVNTDKDRMVAFAIGNISGLKDKYQLKVQFNITSMTTNGAEAERLINQFVVRKFMMKQLNALGRITYNGHFEVLYKKVQFAGRLGSVAGPIDFQFALDGLNKYVYGSTKTDSFMLGRVMDMPEIGKIVCKANFKFDISKPRTAIMRRKLGGKLPIGHVDADIPEARYKKLTVRNITAEINSNGAVADGHINVKGKRVDVLCSFSFTNTDQMQKTKIKPGIRFHKMSDEDKAERDARKAAEAAAKAEIKAQKRAVKDSLKAVKNAAKAEKKAAKEQEKAVKDAIKAQEKAAKAAAKAARKAQKDSIKAAKKAASQ